MRRPGASAVDVAGFVRRFGFVSYNGRGDLHKNCFYEGVCVKNMCREVQEEAWFPAGAAERGRVPPPPPPLSVCN